MLLVLIALAWLAVVTVLVAVCQAAGRSERQQRDAREGEPEMVRDGLAVWDAAAARDLRAQYAARSRRVRPRVREDADGHVRSPVQAPRARGLGR